jgi:hypothetical protein
MHELSGSFEKHPERKRKRKNEPKPKGVIGDAPASFNPDLSVGREMIQIWDEIVQQAPPGVLTFSDRMHVEVLCRLLYKIRHNLAKSGDYARAESLLGKMGMNPSDRSKVNLAPTGPIGPQRADAETSNPFARIAAEGANAAVN